MTRTQQHMRRILAVVFMLAAGGISASDVRDNENVITRVGAPLDNRLVIEQSDSGAHSVTLHLEDTNALLASDNWVRDPLSNLRPGRVVQTGSAHNLTARFAGQGHQIAVRQSGRSHSAWVNTQGRANIVSIAQTGQGNIADISQAGLRNSVAIFQN